MDGLANILLIFYGSACIGLLLGILVEATNIRKAIKEYRDGGDDGTSDIS